MNRNLIYIGDDLLDLDISTVIAITIQSINAGDLKLRNVSHTNQFKVRDTENNCRVFGYVNNEWSASSKPYQYNECKVVQDGIETLRGLLVVTKFEKGYFYCNIYEDLFNIFSYLAGKKIKDIDPIPASAWTSAQMDSTRNATSGIIAAVVNWGHSLVEIFNSNFFLPSFYYHTFITEILGETGLTLSGDILTDARFTDLVIPFPGDEFQSSGDIGQAAPSFIAKGTNATSTNANVLPLYPGSIAANDILFVLVMSNQEGGSVGSIATPTGYLQIDQRVFRDSIGNLVGSAALFYKIADGSEAGGLTITRGGSTGAGMFFDAQIYQLRGNANITMEQGNVYVDWDSTITFPGLTVGGVKRTLLAFVAQNSSITNPGTPTGYTNSASDVANLYLELNTLENVSTAPQVTATNGSSDGWVTFSVAIYNNEDNNVEWNDLWPDIEVTKITIVKPRLTCFYP